MQGCIPLEIQLPSIWRHFLKNYSQDVFPLVLGGWEVLSDSVYLFLIKVGIEVPDIYVN